MIALAGSHRGRLRPRAGGAAARRAPCGCAAPRLGARRPAARAARRGLRRCRCRAAARAAAPRGRRPRLRTRAAVALAAVGPKARGIAPGGVSSSPLVPVPWRSGTTTTSAVARRRPALAAAPPSRPGRALDSPRGCTAPARSPRLRRARSRARPRRSGPPRRCPARRSPRGSAPRRRPTPRRSRRSCARSPRSRAVRSSTSPTIARARSSRSGSATLAPRRCLASEKRLTGRIAAVRIVL